LDTAKGDSGKSKVYALNMESLYEFNIETLKPLVDGGWRNYVLGVVSELKKERLRGG